MRPLVCQMVWFGGWIVWFGVMARKLEMTVQKAGLLAWLSRRVAGLVGKSRSARPARKRRPVPVNPHADQSCDQSGDLAETKAENSVPAVYFSMVFLGTILLGYLAGTDSVLGKGAAVVAVFGNLSVFILLFPKGWEGDLRFAAFLLTVVAPAAYIVASLFGLFAKFG